MQSNNYVQLTVLGLFLLLIGCCLCEEDERQLMGWNKAHGLWGKRSPPQQELLSAQKRPENWQKLNTLWGKRSAPASLSIDPYSEWSKRSSEEQSLKERAQWQMANGLWGRRR